MANPFFLELAKSVAGKLSSDAIDLATAEIKGIWNAKKNLQKMENMMAAICAVLSDAEQKQYTNDAIKLWLRDLKSVVYDIDDLLDEVATDALLRKLNKGHLLRQLRYNLRSNPVFFGFKLSHKIADLRERLDEIVAKKNMFGLTERPVEMQPIERNPLDTFAYVNISDVVGRKEDKEAIMSLLSSATVNSRGLIVLAIVGFGGLGKTTLAKMVYNDEIVNSKFDLKLWACISHEFDLRKTLEDIIKSYTDEISTQNLNIGQLCEKFRSIIVGRKYLLVLDDVWIEDNNVWRDQLEGMLAVGKEGSLILVTTRSETVALNVTESEFVYRLDTLSDDECWSIFKQIALRKDDEKKHPNLVAIGRSIVEKCGGVPLLVKTLAGLLHNVRDEREWSSIQKMEGFMELDKHPLYKGAMQALALSYEKLPSHLKLCFASLSLLSKGVEYSGIIFSCYWSALGILKPENIDDIVLSMGTKCFKEMLSRCLLQDPLISFNDEIISVMMHDLLHDLATRIMGEELAIVTCNEPNVSEMCRHIVWGYEGEEGLSNKGFPNALAKAKKARTLGFSNKVGQVSKSFVEGIIAHFSYLRILDLNGIQFEELPASIGTMKHLRFLGLEFNRLVKVIPSTVCRLVYLETLTLLWCEELVGLPRDMENLTRLRNLSLTTTQESFKDTKLSCLSSLQFLWIYGCMNLMSLWEDATPVHLPSLSQIYIYNCPKLGSLPNSLREVIALECLFIENCQELDLETLENSCWHALRSLSIIGVPKMIGLPDGVQASAGCLQYLFIRDCSSLTALPYWLINFTSLRNITIYDCPNLIELPEGFLHLSNLQKLIIGNCPHLTRRASPPNGEDYPHICHIPLFILDGHQIPSQ